MKKMKDIYVFISLTVIMLIVVFLSMGFGNVYGSMTDWVMQHTVVPDYFRTLFYSTGDLTPNLALNIGAGQNAYYFSYNGLLNPILMLSYLFPFVKMIDYIMIISIVTVIVSAFLIYKWLTSNKIDKDVAIVCAVIFLLIGSFFHAHRHLMFIDYIPFLIMGLMGIDKYFKEHKSYLYIISVFLMIMCSYYYSVGGLLCMVIYGVYRYIDSNNFKSIKIFLIDGAKFLIPMVTGIIMSFILLIPTVLAILASRSQAREVIDLSVLLMPNFNFNGLLYSNYGVGFTAIALISLIYVILHSNKAKRFLSSSLLILFIVPIFMYVLNGMLYLRDKVFIPMSPIIILLVAVFITDLKAKKINPINYLISILIIIIMSLVFKYNEIPFYIDLCITSIGIVLYILKRKLVLVYIPVILIALITSINTNKTDNYVTKSLYNDIKSGQLNHWIQRVSEDDTSFYRMSNLANETSLTVNKIYNANYYQTSIYASTFNSNYKNFFDNVVNNSIPYRNSMLTASSSNIIFQTLMGIKYIVAENNNIPLGYTLVNGDDKTGIYKNNDVFPLGYSSSSLMSNDDFDKLDYPYRNEALLNSIVVGEKTTHNYVSNIVKEELAYNYASKVDIKSVNQKYLIDTDKEEMIKFKLNTPISNQVLFIRFKLNSAPDCKDGDIGIAINGITNKLTCKQWLYFNNNYEFEYAISSSKTIGELNVIFSKGHFEIENVEAYTLGYTYVKKSVADIDKLVVDTYATKGNIIEGKINVTEDGYFATTIPYDKGYTIYVNDKETSYEMVNKAFIGFPISKGTYNIKFVYKSPGYDMGMYGSILGFMLFIGIIIFEHKKHTKRNHKLLS